MDTQIAIGALAALAQETRLSIFRLLVQAGPEGMTVGRIGEALEIPAATLSFHLKELSRSGLLGSRQESRFIWYFANYQAMNELIGYLTENCCRGQPEACDAPCVPKKSAKSTKRVSA
ncbi:MAG: metalloregulator ArsR/SmtB family transcription factor [Gammaproteobacteria bacterium]|nr:metalloregulator ArsR/SmtB family transcription factor [Gammaproteobacteria bacterium]